MPQRASFIPRFCLYVGLALLWCASAKAAEPVLAVIAPSLVDIPLKALIAAMGLALIGGAARTSQRLAGQNLRDPKIPERSVGLTIFADVLTSVTVGMATFFLVAWREFNPLLQAFVITVSGYGGSTFLETYVINIMRRLNAGSDNVKS